MKKALTFIVPVRHPSNAPNWPRVKANLSHTLRSIANQNSSEWRAIVVANRGADLPELPAGCEVAWVDFAANPHYQQSATDRETFYDHIRSDKGRRILAGMLYAGDMGHVMVMDDDDLVSRRIAAFVAASRERNGWYFRDGYVWTDGGRLLYAHQDFSRLCGSSHIVRADLYHLPSSIRDADEKYVQNVLGSHLKICDLFRDAGTPLEPLPFPGAVYRVGQSGVVCGSKGILRTCLLTRDVLVRPWVLSRRALRLRLLTATVKEEFFAISPAPAC